MNKLFYLPGTCAIGIHVLLEEIGKPYEAVEVDRAQLQSQYRDVNPKSKVPALQRDDGSVLTEFPAIAYWLAITNPEKKLFPRDPEAQTRAFELMDYVVSTLHMQGFQRFFRPQNFIADESAHEALKKSGQEIIAKGVPLLDKALDGKEYAVGEFSIADVALYYLEYWLAERMKMDLPPNVAAHYARMKARPSVQAMLKKEGLA